VPLWVPADCGQMSDPMSFSHETLYVPSLQIHPTIGRPVKRATGRRSQIKSLRNPGVTISALDDTYTSYAHYGPHRLPVNTELTEVANSKRQNAVPQTLRNPYRFPRCPWDTNHSAKVDCNAHPLQAEATEERFHRFRLFPPR